MKNKSSKIGSLLFILFIICLIAGGQYLYYMTIHKDDSNIKITKNSDCRVDSKKDYFYYKNEKVISESAEIYYKDLVVNIKGYEHIADSLNEQNASYMSNIKYIKDMNLMSNEIVNYNNDGIYMVTYREYKTFKYDKYASLVIEDYIYDCFDQSGIKGYKGYIFDINTGKLLTDDEVLSRFNTNMESVKEKIREKLNGKQEVVDEVELIKIDDTVNNLKDYAFYIDDTGILNLSYIVKTTKTDYNDSIIIG